MPDTPKAVEAITPYYFDAVKILGTGNSTGLFGALVAYYYFAKGGENVLHWTKITASAFLAGVCFFAVAFFALYSFCVWQVGPPSGQGNATSRVQFWRITALTAGALSLAVWWVGTGLAIYVITLLPLDLGKPFPGVE